MRRMMLSVVKALYCCKVRKRGPEEVCAWRFVQIHVDVLFKFKTQVSSLRSFSSVYSEFRKWWQAWQGWQGGRDCQPYFALQNGGLRGS